MLRLRKSLAWPQLRSRAYLDLTSTRAQAGTNAPLVRPATGIYVPETYSVRLSIKLFNCTPENLPSDLRDQLTSWMSAMPGGATLMSL